MRSVDVYRDTTEKIWMFIVDSNGIAHIYSGRSEEKARAHDGSIPLPREVTEWITRLMLAE